MMGRLSLEDFMQEVKEKLQKRYKNLKVFTSENIKNNGTKVYAVTIVDRASSVSPCVNVEGYYKKFESGECDMEEIIKDIAEIYEKNDLHHDFATNVFSDYDNAASHVRGRLINTEKNTELLKKVPHREFLDLSLIYVVELGYEEQKRVLSMRINNEHIKFWGVTEEDLYSQVKNNMDEMDESSFCSMEEVFKEMIGSGGEEVLEDFSGTYPPMYVLTNKRRLNGAVEILDARVLRRCADVFGKDFIVIPSSIHECLLVPVSEEINDFDYIAKIVRDINDTQVPKDEILSYHVYKYDKQTETMMIVA